MITAIMLWRAVYANGGAGFAPGGFDIHGMLSYFILLNMVRVVTFVEDLQWMLPQWIRRGDLNKYLIRPVDFLLMEWHMRLGGLLMHILLLVPPAAAVCFFAREVLVVPAEGWRWAAFLVSLVLGFQIGFLVSACVGFIAFWMLDTTSILYAIFPIQMLLGGGWFPLDVLPPKVFAVLNQLPWSYQTYFPMRVYLGRVDLAGALLGLLGQLVWIGILAAIAITLWKRGLRRYVAVGG
jgi:ABC-2 type transport system permease protein